MPILVPESGSTAAPYFTLPELRALPDMDNVTRYPDVRLEAARSFVETLIERVCGTSFVGRERSHVLSYTRSRTLFLPDPWVLSLVGMTQSGLPLDTTYIEVVNRQVVWTVSPWAYGLAPVTLTYVAGWSETPPADLKEAALQAARHRLVSVDGASGIPNRATSMTNDFGNISLATAGPNAPTGIPEVDAVILGYRDLTRTAAIA